MIEKKDYRKVQLQLEALLAEKLKDASVRIGDDIHYRGTNIVVTSPAFKDLLPEQRFYHVARAIPSDFYERYLSNGVIWFELAPGESSRDLMKMPRSEDIAGEESAIRRQLAKIDFAGRLLATANPTARRLSPDDFVESKRILADTGLDHQTITKICLFFIRHGAFCDVHVVAEVLPKLETDHSG